MNTVTRSNRIAVEARRSSWRGAHFMKKTALSSRAAMAAGIMLALGAAILWPWTSGRRRRHGGSEPKSRDAGRAEDEPHRSPIALALSADGTRLLAANQTAGTVSLVDTKAGRVLDELKTGDKPVGRRALERRPSRRGHALVWLRHGVLEIKDDKIALAGRVEVGPEPRGVALSADGSTAYVAIGVTNEVARVDLNARKVTGRLPVGREPRGIALTPDGSRLLVSNARSQNVSLIDVKSWKVKSTIPIDGDNLRQVAVSADGKTGYIANMRNRRFRDDPEQHRPGLGPRPAPDPRPARRLGHLRHALARHAGQGGQRCPWRRGQPRREVPGDQFRRHARGHDLSDRPEAAPLADGRLARPDRAGAAQERRPAPASRAGRPTHRAGLCPRRQDALCGELPGRRRTGRRRRIGSS